MRLDLIGVTNRGLFLKSDAEELLFTDVECPCDVLFDTDDSGNPSRQPVGEYIKGSMWVTLLGPEESRKCLV